MLCFPGPACWLSVQKLALTQLHRLEASGVGGAERVISHPPWDTPGSERRYSCPMVWDCQGSATMGGVSMISWRGV